MAVSSLRLFSRKSLLPTQLKCQQRNQEIIPPLVCLRSYFLSQERGRRVYSPCWSPVLFASVLGNENMPSCHFPFSLLPSKAKLYQNKSGKTQYCYRHERFWRKDPLSLASCFSWNLPIFLQEMTKKFALFSWRRFCQLGAFKRSENWVHFDFPKWGNFCFYFFSHSYLWTF